MSSRRRNPDDEYPGKEPFRDYIARLKRETAARTRQAAEALDASPAVVVTTKDGRRTLYIMSGETSTPEDGPLRLSRFAPDGPVGHQVYKSIGAAALELGRDGFETIEPVGDDEVMAWTSTEEFLHGAKVVAYVQAVNTLMWNVRDRDAETKRRVNELMDTVRAMPPAQIEEGTAMLEHEIRRIGAKANPRNQAKRRVRNPPRSNAEAIATFKQLLLENDPNPDVLQTALDVLLEHGITLASASEADPDPILVKPFDLGANLRSSRVGTFVLCEGDVKAIAGVGWNVTVEDDGRYRTHIVWRMDGQSGWSDAFRHDGHPRFTSESDAVHDAITTAWSVVVAMTPVDRPMTWKYARRTLQHPPLAKIPDELVAPPENEISFAKANPPRSRSQAFEAFWALLLDEDPASVEMAQDVLLEHDLTLIEASYSEGVPGFFRRELAEAGGIMGTFVIGEVNDRISEGVAWYVTPTSTGNKFFVTVVVHINPMLTPEIDLNTAYAPARKAGLAPRRFNSFEEGAKFAVERAWQAVVKLKRNRFVGHAAAADTIASVREGSISKDSARDVAWRRAEEVLWDSAVDIHTPPELLDTKWLDDQLHDGDLTENPPWVTSMLAEAFENLAGKVPPAWMPKLDQVRAGARGTLVAEMTEYGCGAYGCVLPTLDPAVVLKVTTDTTEAEFAAKLAGSLVAPVCVAYHLVISLAAKYQGRAVFLLWRESADDVGDLPDILGDDALDLVDEQHRCAQEAYLAMREGTDGEISKSIRAWEGACEAMGSQRDLRPLATGMLKIYDEQRIFFGDIHAGNLGRVFRGQKRGEWVITDPGHVAVVGG